MQVVRWVSLASLLALCGCGQFFPPINGGGGGCTTNCNQTNNLYIGNQIPTAPTLAAFTLSSTALTPVSGSPYAVGTLPSVVAITPLNKFLYVGGGAGGGIIGFSINSDGSLTALNSGSPLEGVTAAAMQVEGSGSYLVTAQQSPPTSASTLAIFSIDPSTGLLSAAPGAPSAIPMNDIGTPNNMVIAPAINGTENIFITLGTGGIEIFSLATSNGATTFNRHYPSLGIANADNGVTLDAKAAFLFVTETGANGARVFTVAGSGALTEIKGSPFSTGLGPSAVLVDASNTYVYVTNATDGSISAFALGASGVLTPLSGSPFTGVGQRPVGIVEDRSKTYIAVINSGGSPDLRVYTIDTAVPGKLNAFATASTGVDPASPVTIVATH